MKDPVIITEYTFKRGERIFSEYSDRIQWIVCPAEEETVARKVLEEKARIVVLGVDRYQGPLYEALSDTAKPAPAIIVRHGVGYDGINTELCRKHNIFLAITPGVLDQSVAEHAIALLMSLARNIPYLDREFHEGRFVRKPGFELKGKILGIAGFGRIGKSVAAIASCGLGMTVEAFDLLPLARQAEGEGISEEAFRTRYGLRGYHTEFEPFARLLDALSINLPLNKATTHFINAHRLAALKDGAILINTGRGPLVDEKALYAALVSGKLGSAGLDVFEREPYTPVLPEMDLRTLPNAILTPHAASDTEEANERMQRMVMENIFAYIQGKFEKLNRVV